ncbi:MAG: hypothetical protein FJX76_16965 [Armatimonadetes bacterium]|nr:hypothetical protein [Armatimonadota bacterium]
MMITHNTVPTRTRNKDGRFRQKRADTHLGTLEARYGEISDRRHDCHLGTIRAATHRSLSKLVHGEPEVTHKPGLSGRVRNQDGRLRAKRSDTHLSTLEKTYGPICAMPGNTTLAMLRSMSGDHSLSWILAHPGVLDAA